MISESFLVPVRRVSRAIMNTLDDMFVEPEFDIDNCALKFIDQSDHCILLGLFETDENDQLMSVDPVATWTIEVSCCVGKDL